MAMLLNSFLVVPGFQPDDIAGLMAWWDAQDGSTITFGTGSNVQQWDDKSVNNHNLFQGLAGKQPSTVLVSGRQMIQFDGIDENFIITPNPTGLNVGANDFEFHVVYRTAQTGVRGELLAKGGAIRYHMRVNNAAPSDDMTVAIDDDTTAVVLSDSSETWNDDTVRIVSMIRDGNNFRQLEDFNEVPASPLDITGYGNLDNTGNFFVGSFDGAGTFFDGEIGEIIMYDSALSTGDRADVEAYLKNKWNVA